jgi:hypothetical protein
VQVMEPGRLLELLAGEVPFMHEHNSRRCDGPTQGIRSVYGLAQKTPACCYAGPTARELTSAMSGLFYSCWRRRRRMARRTCGIKFDTML